MKTWEVKFDSIDLCADKSPVIYVKANTERKARIIAKNNMEKLGHKYCNIAYAVEKKE